MVNKTVLEYLRLHKGNYKLADLKKKILNAGYSKKDIDDALNQLNKDSSKSPPSVNSTVNKINKMNLNNENTPNKNVLGSLNKDNSKIEIKPLNENDLEDNKNTNYKGLFKIGGICAVIGVLIIFINVFFEGLISSILGIVSLGFFIVFFLSFVFLGKKYNSKLIKISNIGFIVLLFLAIIFQVVIFISPDFVGVLKADPENLFEDLMEIGLMFLIGGGIYFLILIVLGILNGIGLMKLKKVKYAKLTGILEVIGWPGLIFVLGVLALMISFVMKIMILFKEE